MYFEITFPIATVRAHGAGIGFLARVDHFVAVEIRSFGESFFAVRAFQRLFLFDFFRLTEGFSRKTEERFASSSILGCCEARRGERRGVENSKLQGGEILHKRSLTQSNVVFSLSNILLQKIFDSIECFFLSNLLLLFFFSEQPIVTKDL